MFQFRRFPTYGYLIHHMLTDSSSAGFPHSEIRGSQAAFASPRLIVDRYVLRRLLVPRHSPYALSSLTMFFSRDSSVLRLRSRRRSTDSSRKVLILCSNHLVLIETVQISSISSACTNRAALRLQTLQYTKYSFGFHP